MNQHQPEERPKRSCERQHQDGNSPDQVTESEIFLSGKMAIRILVAEEHADNCGDGERVEDPRLLDCREIQTGQVPVNQRQPTSPDEEFEHHHDEEAEADRSIHNAVRVSLSSFDV